MGPTNCSKHDTCMSASCHATRSPTNHAPQVNAALQHVLEPERQGERYLHCEAHRQLRGMSEKSAHATRPQPQHHAPSTKPEKKWEIHPIMIMLENMNIMLFFMPSIMPPPGPIMFKLCCGPGSFFRRNKPRTLSPLSPRYSNCNRRATWVTHVQASTAQGCGIHSHTQPRGHIAVQPHSGTHTHTYKNTHIQTHTHTLRRAKAVAEMNRMF